MLKRQRNYEMKICIGAKGIQKIAESILNLRNEEMCMANIVYSQQRLSKGTCGGRGTLGIFDRMFIIDEVSLLHLFTAASLQKQVWWPGTLKSKGNVDGGSR